MLLYVSGQEDTQGADRSGEEMCPRWKATVKVKSN